MHHQSIYNQNHEEAVVESPVVLMGRAGVHKIQSTAEVGPVRDMGGLSASALEREPEGQRAVVSDEAVAEAYWAVD